MYILDAYKYHERNPTLSFQANERTLCTVRSLLCYMPTEELKVLTLKQNIGLKFLVSFQETVKNKVNVFVEFMFWVHILG